MFILGIIVIGNSVILLRPSFSCLMFTSLLNISDRRVSLVSDVFVRSKYSSCDML